MLVRQFPTVGSYVEHCAPFTKHYTRRHALKSAEGHFDMITYRKGVFWYLGHDCRKQRC